VRRVGWASPSFPVGVFLIVSVDANSIYLLFLVTGELSQPRSQLGRIPLNLNFFAAPLMNATGKVENALRR
jgi:hypothetical protein